SICIAGFGIINQIDPSLSSSTSEITCVGSFTMELLSVKNRALCNSIILLFSGCASVMISGVIAFIIRVKMNVLLSFVLAARFSFSGGHLSENNQHTRAQKTENTTLE